MPDEPDVPGMNRKREVDYALESLSNLIYLIGYSLDEAERIQDYIQMANQQVTRVRSLVAKGLPGELEG